MKSSIVGPNDATGLSKSEAGWQGPANQLELKYKEGLQDTDVFNKSPSIKHSFTEGTSMAQVGQRSFPDF